MAAMTVDGEVRRGIALLAGDVTITGTLPGVGVFRTPSIFVRDGDEISVDIEGIGTLANRCVEEMV